MKKNILITGYPKSGKTTLIKKLIENDEIVTEMVINGKSAIKNIFNWESEALKLTKIYSEL